MAESPHPTVMRVPELSRLLDLSERVIYRSAREKGEVAGIPAIVEGRCVRFSRKQVERRLRGEPVYQRHPESGAS